jgi:hypothetical protein
MVKNQKKVKKVKKVVKIVKVEKKSEIVRGYDEKLDTWRCILCGVNLGKENPRQLCSKTFCSYVDIRKS